MHKLFISFTFFSLIFFSLNSFANEVISISGESAKKLSGILSSFKLESKPESNVGPSLNRIAANDLKCRFFKKGIAAGITKWSCGFTDAATLEKKAIVNGVANDLAKFLIEDLNLEPTHSEVESTYTFDSVLCTEYFNLPPLFSCSLRPTIQEDADTHARELSTCDNPKARRLAETALKQSQRLRQVYGVESIQVANCDEYNLANILRIPHAMNMPIAQCGVQVVFNSTFPGNHIEDFARISLVLGGSIQVFTSTGSFEEVPICISR